MKKIVIGVIAIIVLGAGWYALSPRFINKVVDEPVPSGGRSGTTTTGSDAITTPEMTEAVMTNRIPVVATPAHPASGFVRVVKDGTARYLRYEDYKTINGPDVRVYLAADLEAKDFIDLGPLKGTEGNINYEIPAGTDLGKYRYALTWCEDFSVLFNSAELSF